MSGLRLRERAVASVRPGVVAEQWPFAWRGDDGSGGLAPGVDALHRRRVVQCALSRVCGACAEPLGRPVVFIGEPGEVARNAFHAPPLHAGCARTLLGARGAHPHWVEVRTAGFEFVRPGRDEPEDRPTFQPNSLLEEPPR